MPKKKPVKKQATQAQVDDDLNDLDFKEDQVKKPVQPQKSESSGSAKPQLAQKLEQKQFSFYSDVQLELKQRVRIIVWFRNDLRLHDNPVLSWTQEQVKRLGSYAQVIPIFCFDPRLYIEENEKYSTRKAGIVKTKFHLETVEVLRKSLEDIGLGLLVFFEKPEITIPTLKAKDRYTTVVYSREICPNEAQVERNVRSAVYEHDKKAVFVDIHSNFLYHKDDLDIDFEKQISYTDFKKKVKNVRVRKTVETPKKDELGKLSKLIANGTFKGALKFLPSLEDFGFDKEDIEAQDKGQAQGDFKFQGGETIALKHLNSYIHKNKTVENHQTILTKHEEVKYSSRLSPWLSIGALSIRRVYEELKKFIGKTKSTGGKNYFGSILYSDYFKYWCMINGKKVFEPYGILDTSMKMQETWKTDVQLVFRWREGRTGMPLVDAIMRELNATGHVSHRCRMIAASYLTVDLKQDWRMGAMYFEEKLIDHDVHSNYGGWNFQAGLGQQKGMQFNILVQSFTYDITGSYIRKWVPELTSVPKLFIHAPWDMNAELQSKFGLSIEGEELGKGRYPQPISCEKYTGQGVQKQLRRLKQKQKEKRIGYAKDRGNKLIAQAKKMNKNKDLDETDQKIKMMQSIFNKNRQEDLKTRKKRKLDDSKLKEAKKAQKAQTHAEQKLKTPSLRKKEAKEKNEGKTEAKKKQQQQQQQPEQKKPQKKKYEVEYSDLDSNSQEVFDPEMKKFAEKKKRPKERKKSAPGKPHYMRDEQAEASTDEDQKSAKKEKRNARSADNGKGYGRKRLTKAEMKSMPKKKAQRINKMLKRQNKKERTFRLGFKEPKDTEAGGMPRQFGEKPTFGTNLDVHDDDKNEPIPWGLTQQEKKQEKKRWRDNPEMKEKHKMMKQRGPLNRGGKKGAKKANRWKRFQRTKGRTTGRHKKGK